MSILGFSSADVLSILQLGFAGVAFLFLVMSFILLLNEQKRDSEPRENILRSIRQFSLLSLAFVVLVALMSFMDGQSQPEGNVSEQCQESIERAKILTEDKGSYTLDSMYELLRNTLSDCNTDKE